ncbi:MAG TPA: hypothetical protein VGX96_05255, partial [Candidatus Elarobacter sp.]|nr:hypothetical protein [Candidatus Elarobacter sp.]
DGDTDADDVRLRVAIPPETEAIEGSFVRDEVELDGEALLGEGLRVGTVAAATSIRIRFTLRVLPGTESVDILAYADAPGVPTIAPPALRLTRRTGHVAYDAPRPFYELESGETDTQLAQTEANASAERSPPPQTIDTVIDEAIVLEQSIREPVAPEPIAEATIVHELVIEEAIIREPVVDEPAAIEIPVVPAVGDELIAPAPLLAEPPPAATEPQPERAPDAVPEMEAPRERKRPSKRKPKRKAAAQAPADAAQEVEAQPEVADDETVPEPLVVVEHVLARAVDADEVRALERVFAGAVPHGLAALALLSSVAAVDTPLGVALGTRDFARSVAAALPRALVAARMSRPTPAVVTPETLGAIHSDASAAGEPLDFEGPVMVTRLDDRELDALRAVLGRALDDPFLRGVQVLLAVAPRALEGVPDDVGPHVRDMFTAYRIAAGAWLMRVTVRRAVDRRYDPLTADDPTLHAAGRDLVAALRVAIA